MAIAGSGFPQLKRHIASLARKPPAHSGYRKFHASDVVYEAMRRGVKLTAPRGAEGPPSASQSVAAKIPGAKPKLKSNRAVKSLMRRPK